MIGNVEDEVEEGDRDKLAVVSKVTRPFPVKIKPADDDDDIIMSEDEQEEGEVEFEEKPSRELEGESAEGANETGANLVNKIFNQSQKKVTKDTKIVPL